MTPAEVEGLFQTFWEVYPRKTGKAAARKKFEKVIKDGNDPEEIIEAVGKQIKAKVLVKGDKYCPEASAWLNKGRWEDEVRLPTAAKKKPVERKVVTCDRCNYEYLPHRKQCPCCGQENRLA